MARPQKEEIPLSAARISAQLTPEAQQIVNKLMKDGDVKDRSQIIDIIVKDYGKKVKGIEPGMLIQTKDGLTALSTGKAAGEASEDDMDEADKSLTSVMTSMGKQIRFKQMRQMLKEFEDKAEKGDFNLEDMMKWSMAEKLMNKEESTEGLTSKDMMEMSIMKNMFKDDGSNPQMQQLQNTVNTMQNEIRSSKSDGRPSDIAQLEQSFNRQIEKIAESNKYNSLVDRLETKFEASLKNQKPDEALKYMEKVEQIKADKAVEIEKEKAKHEQFKDTLEKQRIEHQQVQFEYLRQQMDEGMAGSGMNKKMREKMDEMLVKNFDKALRGGKEDDVFSKTQGLLDSLGNTLKEPILEPIGKAISANIREGREQTAMPMPQTRPAMPAPQAEPATPAQPAEFPVPEPPMAEPAPAMPKVQGDIALENLDKLSNPSPIIPPADVSYIPEPTPISKPEPKS